MRDCRTCAYCNLQIGLDCHVYVCKKAGVEQRFINKPNANCRHYYKDDLKTGDFYIDLDNQTKK